MAPLDNEAAGSGIAARPELTSRLTLLNPDNFTPPARTPWGGRNIVDIYKRFALSPSQRAHCGVVGESWELSVGPEFPSATESSISLEAWLAANSSDLLGIEASLGHQVTALLVKWLDASDHLSVQIHPSDDYCGLGPDETGKSECWYVLAHEPGAGLFLGFKSGVTPEKVRETLENRGDFSALMSFVAVAAGDLIVIEPGTPHAIGKGVTLIEPQYVKPGRRAVTYRYWDWHRRYDAEGRLQNISGNPRALHVEQALAVTDWPKASAEAVLSACVLRAGPPDTSAAATVQPLCGNPANAPLASSRLQVARLCGCGPVSLPDWSVFRALTVVEGEVRLLCQGEEKVVPMGRTVAIGASLGYIQAHLSQAHALLCAVLV
jgi:mannose-6-phosphate isomerase class I